LKYYGPVTKVDVVIPQSLQGKISYNNSQKKRIEKSPTSAEDYTVLIPQSQISKLIQSGGYFIYFRSNEFETEVMEVRSTSTQDKLHYV
jgi:hypothetical protein